MILKNKNILIMGIRNKWSIAWGAAQSAASQGANLIFSYHPTEDKKKLKELIKEIPNSKAYVCDVSDDNNIKELFSKIKEDYGKIDGIMHSIAHAKTEDLRGNFSDTSREGFKHALDISAYSLIAIGRYAKDILNDGASITTLTYHGSTKVYDEYNVMGVAKAALECSVRYLSSDFRKDEHKSKCNFSRSNKNILSQGHKGF